MGFRWDIGALTKKPRTEYVTAEPLNIEGKVKKLEKKSTYQSNIPDVKENNLSMPMTLDLASLTKQPSGQVADQVSTKEAAPVVPEKVKEEGSNIPWADLAIMAVPALLGAATGYRSEGAQAGMVGIKAKQDLDKSDYEKKKNEYDRMLKLMELQQKKDEMNKKKYSPVDMVDEEGKPIAGAFDVTTGERTASPYGSIKGLPAKDSGALYKVQTPEGQKYMTSSEAHGQKPALTPKGMQYRVNPVTGEETLFDPNTAKVKPLETTAFPAIKYKQDGKEAEFKPKPNQMKAINQESTKFNADPMIRKIKEDTRAGDSIVGLVSTGQIGQSLALVKAMRAAGDTHISNFDKEAAEQRKDVLGKLEAGLTKASTGNLLPAQVKELVASAKSVNEINKKVYNREAQNYSKRLENVGVPKPIAQDQINPVEKEFKTLNGVKYEKVQGGWKKVANE